MSRINCWLQGFFPTFFAHGVILSLIGRFEGVFMTPPDDFGQMPTGDFSRIQDLCEQLEQAWKEFDGSTDGVDLEPLLQAGGETLRLSALYELIKTEMPLRLENGLPWDLDYYLDKYPELGGSESLSVHLILEECLVRKRHGMRISISNYTRRFHR